MLEFFKEKNIVFVFTENQFVSVRMRVHMKNPIEVETVPVSTLVHDAVDLEL